MKILLPKLLKCRLVQTSSLLAFIAILAAGVAAAALGPVHYRLGGSFIASPATGGGVYWSALQAPLDSAGRTAALRINIHSYPPEMVPLLAISGADAVTDAVGQLAMTSNDTAIGSLVWYGLKQGNPPVVKQIWIWTGTTTWVSSDTYVVDGTNTVYDAAVADQDHDGLPDPGAPSITAFPWGAKVSRVLP